MPFFHARAHYLWRGGSSHLAALRDDHVLVGLVLAAISRLGGLHHLDDVHAVDHLSEHDVLIVQEGRRDGCDEEL